uniref:Uncharacterized protein n=1 Tax=Tanacetum cinerariifolium TaxID=118510 RepID=A0A699JNA7_TANCI|nr:hypothetical protein [Tanacetum cinerariifolium]
MVVWPAVDGDEGGVVIAARWGVGCGVEGGGDVVVVLEAVATAVRVGTGVRRKRSPEMFFGGGGVGRRWPVVVAGNNREREGQVCVFVQKK